MLTLTFWGATGCLLASLLGAGYEWSRPDTAQDEPESNLERRS